MPRIGRELMRIDTQLANGAFPLVIEMFVEQQPLVRRCRKPAVRLDLGVELAGTPSGIAESQNTLPRSIAAGDRRDLEVRLSSSRSILVPRGFDPADLRQLITTLESC